MIIICHASFSIASFLPLQSVIHSIGCYVIIRMGDVAIPDVVEDLCSKRILTMTFEEGLPC
jgi:hypothetical protein